MKYDDEDAQGFDPTGEIPVVSPVDPRVTIVGAEIASEVAESVEEESILPHWTEAPTGQIPAVLSRESDAVVDDPWASIPAPAWREGEADWVAHDEQFDPSLLGDAVVAEDKQPWEFNDEPVVDEEELLHEAPRPAPTRAQRTRRPARENPLEGRAARAGTQKNIPVAIATGLLAAAAVILIFMLGTIPVMVLISAALVLACVEAFAAFRAVGAHPATLLGIVGTLALSITSYNRGEAAMPLVTALFLFFTVLWYLGAEKKVDVLDGVGATVFVYAWIGILGSFAALMVSPINYPNKHGLAFLIGAIVRVPVVVHHPGINRRRRLDLGHVGLWIWLRTRKIRGQAADFQKRRLHGGPRHAQLVVGDVNPALNRKPILARAFKLILPGLDHPPWNVDAHRGAGHIETKTEVNALD